MNYKTTISILLLLFSFSSKATHLYGGEITWECLSDGRFIFTLDHYRECSWAPFFGPNYTQGAFTTLDVLGTTRPLDQNNQTVNSIIVTADWHRYQTFNGGDISPICPDSNGITLYCSSDDGGAKQQLRWVSDTIELKGVPPIGGWTFKWDGFARAPTENVPQVTLCLFSVMYPVPDPSGSGFLDASHCDDSSPRLAALPEVNFCRGEFFSFTHAAQDIDLDSVSYAWERPRDANLNYIQSINGYAYDRPFPDQSQDPRNIPSSLDPETGVFRQSVYSGSAVDVYSTTIRVDSWRCGHRISSVVRDLPIMVWDCEPIDSRGQQNVRPTTFFNGLKSTHLEIEATAGDLIEFDFAALDSNVILGDTQDVFVEVIGDVFADDYQTAQNCAYGPHRECATLSPPPSIYTIGNRQEFRLSGNQVQTHFRWQTSSESLRTRSSSFCGNSTEGLETKTFHILFKTYDEACPIRKSEYATASIRLIPSETLGNPILKGASVDLNGNVNLQWVPPMDSNSLFLNYSAEGASVTKGQNPVNYSALQNQVLNYKQEVQFPYLNFPANPWSPLPGGQDYYFRMNTYASGPDSLPSSYSEPVRIIELEANPSMNYMITGEIELNWNAPKPVNPQSKTYFIYESPTWYYVWQSNDASADLSQAGVWYQRDQKTTVSSGSLYANTCSPSVALRIEARDTVITYKQGSGFLNPNYDTMVFSSFSIPDTVSMRLINPIIRNELYEYFTVYSDGGSNYQWKDCQSNAIIPNSNNDRYIPSDTGRFKVIVGSGSCQDSSLCFINDIVLDPGITQTDNQSLRSNSSKQKFQWMDCRADTLIPGARSRSFQPTDTGYYAVIVSAYGYRDTSDCIPMLAIGLSENELKDQISIYPNPSTGQIWVKSEGPSIQQIQVFSIEGQLLLERSIALTDNNLLNLDQPSGVYLIQIQSEDGRWLTKKHILY